MSALAWTLAILGLVGAAGLVAAAAWALTGTMWSSARTQGTAVSRSTATIDAPGTTLTRLSGGTAVARGASYAGLALALGAAAVLGTLGVAVLAAILGAIALLEWSRISDLPRHHVVALQVANLAIVAVIAAAGSAGSAWLVGGIVLAGTLWPVVRPDPGRAMRDLGLAAVGCAIIPGSLAHGVALAQERGEVGLVLFVALAVVAAFSDVAAFLSGRRFGRTPLAPRLSPSKTRAGLVGNLLGAAVGMAIFAGVLVPALGLVPVLLLVPAVGLGAVWGDLLQSAAKREAGVKDTARWLPGFGGLLDRVDSLLVVLPLAYWTLRILDLAGVS
jgi:phosphatidate cytidylyltransferase